MASRIQGLLVRLRDETGSNLVEAALVLPILIVLASAVFEFSSMLYVQMAMQNGANQGARFAVTRAVLSGLSREASIRQIVRDETPIVSLTDADITFSNMPLGGSTWASGTGTGNTVERVTVTYAYPIMSVWMQPFFGGGSTLTFTVTATMKNEGDLEP